MLNASLFAIVFLWLLVLSVWKANVTAFLKSLEDERDKVLKFIDESKATMNKNHQHQTDQELKASPPAGERSQNS